MNTHVRESTVRTDDPAQQDVRGSRERRQRVWGTEGNETDADIHTKMGTFGRGSRESSFAWSIFSEMEFLSQKDICDFWS